MKKMSHNRNTDINTLFLDNIKKYKHEIFILFFTFVVFYVIHLRVSIDQIHFVDMFRYFQDNFIEQGYGRFFRGLLNVFLTISGYNYISYYLYFIISLIFISISFLLLLKFLDIEKNILLSIIIVLLSSSYECFSGIFCFIYDAPFYFLAFLLSNISLLIIKDNYYKYKNIIVFMILNLLSLFIYQSFFIYASAMLIVYLIKNDLIDNIDYKTLLKKVLYHGAILFVTFIIFSILFKLFHHLLPNGHYEWGSELPLQYLNAYKVLLCYVKFFGLFFADYRAMNHTVIIKIVYFIITMSILYYSIFALCKKKKYIQFILLLILPICVSVISFINFIKPTMMFANLSLYYLWVLVLYNKFTYLRFIDIKSKLSIVVFSLSIILIFSHNLYKTVGSYEYYLDIEKKNINFLTRLATKIEMCEGYNIDSCIYINEGGKDIPRLQDKISYNIVDYFENGMVGTTLQEIDWPYSGMIYNMLSHLTGLKIKTPDNDTVESILNSNDYKNMGIYPSYDSIKCINDVIVVKLYSE